MRDMQFYKPPKVNSQFALPEGTKNQRESWNTGTYGRVCHPLHKHTRHHYPTGLHHIYVCLLLECTSVIRTAPFKVKHANTWCLCETIPEGLQIQLRKNAMSCGREDKCYTGRKALLIVTNLLASLKCLCLKKETECDRKTTLNRNVILLLYRDFLVNFGMQLQSHILICYILNCYCLLSHTHQSS